MSYTPGDVLTVLPVLGGLPAIFIAAESLGLTTARSGTAGIFGADALDLLKQPCAQVPSIGPWGLRGLAGLLLAIPLSIEWLRRLRKA